MGNIGTFVSLVVGKFRVQAKFLHAAVDGLSREETESFESYVDFCLKSGLALDYLADCYLTIVQDTYAEQIYFMKHGKYRNTSFAEVEKAVYGNPSYMERYMLGLALTSFLWPNHREMSRFFLEQTPNNQRGDYLEIGPGHGYYFLKALTGTSYDSFTAVDVSAKSIDLTKKIIAHFAPDHVSKTRLLLLDFLNSDLPPASFDAVVMSEVLEHIEQPSVFMKRLWELSRPGGFVFMTTCVNAPAIDHISLFRTTDEVERVCTDAGFAVKAKLDIPYFGKTIEECAVEKLAINVAYNLERLS
jgi:SAM-dependent methyltransferase